MKHASSDSVSRKRKARISPLSSHITQSTKRSKTFKHVEPTSKLAILPKGKRQSRRVALEKLNWKKVDMTDRFLDDFEGFYGLEEVDDVEVVRDGNLVSYQTSALESQDSEIDGAESTVSEESNEPAKEEEQEWSGFGEDEVDEAKPGDSAAAAVPNIQDTPMVGKKAKRNRTAEQPSEANPFDSLPEERHDDFDVSAWLPLHLSPETLASIAHLKFSAPTPIQTASIPEILAGRDVIGKAVTGSGKTLAFGIPILEHYLSRDHGDQARHADPKDNAKNAQRPPPLAIIVAPTRELAHQITKHLRALCTRDNFRGPSIATFTGGLALQKQQRVLAKAEIVVGTPGRLWEIMSTSSDLIEWFQRTKYLVIDEADRLLSEGQFKELEQILDLLDRKVQDDELAEPEAEPEVSKKKRNTQKSISKPKRSKVATQSERQILVFSATFHKGLQQKLAGKAQASSSSSKGGDSMDQEESTRYLLQKLSFQPSAAPIFVDATPTIQLQSGLQEGIVECAATEKDLSLYCLLLQHLVPRTLVFTNSIPTTQRLVPLLKNLGLQKAYALHSHMAQKARLRALEQFSSSASTSSTTNTSTNPQEQSILIATDIAARGLDLPSVALVVHYHAPQTPTSYIHRSGRTARGAASTGASALLCSPAETSAVSRLLRKVHSPQQDNQTAAHRPRTLTLDPLLLGKLKPRVQLAKRIADAEAERAKAGSKEAWVREAAEELGLDEEELDGLRLKGDRGRGRARDSVSLLPKDGKANGDGRRGQRERDEVRGWKAELAAMLKGRLNLGVSARYVADGRVDLNEILRERERGGGESGDGGEGGLFLGRIGGVGFA